MFKNKKGIIILIISLVAVYFLICIINIIPTGKKYDHTVFIGASTKVNIKNGNIYVYNEDKKIAKQDIKLYFKDNFVDGYVTFTQGASSGVENAYMFYNTNGDNLIPDSIFIATTPDLKINIKKSISEEVENIDVINDILALNNLKANEELELNYAKIDYLDIDEDGIEDKIYSIGLIKEELNNYNDEKVDETEEFYLDELEEENNDEIKDEYSEEIEDEDEEEFEEETEEIVLDQDYISFVYLKMGNSSEYVLIQTHEGSYDGISNERLSFVKLIDFDNNGYYEFVIEKMMGEYGPYYYELYNFDGSKFTKIGGE